MEKMNDDGEFMLIKADTMEMHKLYWILYTVLQQFGRIDETIHGCSYEEISILIGDISKIINSEQKDEKKAL